MPTYGDSFFRGRSVHARERSIPGPPRQTRAGEKLPALPLLAGGGVARRNELAFRLGNTFADACDASTDGYTRVLPNRLPAPSVDVTHRDVIPSTLLARLAASLGTIALLVDAALDRVVGWVEVESTDAAPVESPRRMRAAVAFAERLRGGLVVAFGTSLDASRPPGRELAFVDAFVTPDGPSSRLRVRAYLSPDALSAVSPPAAGVEPRGARATPDLVVELSVLRARTRLELGELRALAAGDLVTLDHVFRDVVPATAPGLATPIWLAHHERAFVRVAHHETLTEPHEVPMPRSPRTAHATRATREPDDDGGGFDDLDDLDDRGHLDVQSTPESGADFADEIAEDDAFVDVDSLAIELSVEVARIGATVGELERLAVGAVLATGAPLGRSVVLRSRGQRIADGELVELDGELAVRITATARSGRTNQ